MGGRGSSAAGHVGVGFGGGGFSANGVGFKPYDTLKEALGTRGKPKSMGDAMMNSNPHFDPNMTYREFTENCQRCVVAYEARRRGYDVTAQPTYQGDMQGAVAYENPNTGVRNNYWMGSFKGAKPKAVGANTATQAQSNVEKQMSNYGENSRAIMQLRWMQNGREVGGHVINIERRNGKTHYIDAQSGERYNPKSLFANINPKNIQLTRTDNLALSERAKKAITKDHW